MSATFPLPPAALSYRDAAAHIGISYGSLKNLMAGGRGPKAIRLSARTRLIRIVDIDSWLAIRSGEIPQAVAVPRRRGRPTKAESLSR